VNGTILTITQITGILKEIIETGFPDVTIQGEITNWRPSGSGHVYFSLKDSGAVIQAVLFRQNQMSLDFRPADGQMVIAEGRLSVYPQRGNYQIICRTLRAAGKGQLLAMLEERKNRLAAEGLFDSDRKRLLPLFPRTVAVVTSPTGAAIRDILRVLKSRNAGVKIVVLPCLVQGDEAGRQIASRIRTAGQFAMADVIIVARGGGSLEDLLPFSDEGVVRAIAASPVPVITGIGHEIDFSLADLAADVRAATPSQAAEIVSGRTEDFTLRLENARSVLEQNLENRLDLVKRTLLTFSREELERSFHIKLEPLLLRLDDSVETLLHRLQGHVDTQRHRVALLRSELEGYSPVTILDRGYALITDKVTGNTLKTTGEMTLNRDIDIRLAGGHAGARITEPGTNIHTQETQ
jgi:exodeoxyribonuclease VII large subunit